MNQSPNKTKGFFDRLIALKQSDPKTYSQLIDLILTLGIFIGIWLSFLFYYVKT